MSDVGGGVADSVDVELRDAGAVGQARLSAKQLAHELGAQGEAADRLVLVVSELATSLVVHGGGTIVMRPRPGRTVVVIASAQRADSHQCPVAALGQNLVMVRRLAASVSVEPGERITAIVGLG